MSAMTTENKPRTRQRAYKPPPTLEVPHIDEDAAERKRVLNVLAQRRYREKKRLHRLKTRPASSSAEKEKSRSTGSPSTSSSLGTTPTTSSSAATALESDVGSWDVLDDVALSALIPDTAPLPDFLTGLDQMESSPSYDFFAATLDPSCLLDTSSSAESDVSFPDSYHLPVHELTLLRAMLRIAERIGCRGKALWSLTCTSPFNSGEGTPAEQLPVNWRPTASQRTVPHHPLIDFLPWPGVRDRILMILALPDQARPPHASGQLAVANLAYDVEDASEGVRIYGGDPYDPKSWEVGQVLFERWWFLFDRDIIATSNTWRRLRGAPPLALSGSSPSPDRACM